jgi:hypothetical protein
MNVLTARTALWRDGHTINAPELMTRSTATMLARRIEGYWRKRGQTVTCRVEQLVGERLDGRGAVHCVRSNMLNGVPR